MLAKPAMPIGVMRGFGAAGDHDVGIAVLDGLEGVADGVGRRWRRPWRRR